MSRSLFPHIPNIPGWFDEYGIYHLAPTAYQVARAMLFSQGTRGKRATKVWLTRYFYEHPNETGSGVVLGMPRE